MPIDRTPIKSQESGGTNTKPTQNPDKDQGTPKFYSPQGDFTGVSKDLLDQVELDTDKYFVDINKDPDNRAEWQAVFDKILTDKMSALGYASGTLSKQPSKTGPPRGTLADINLGNLSQGTATQNQPKPNDPYSTDDLTPEELNELEELTFRYFQEQEIDNPPDQQRLRVFNAMLLGKRARDQTISQMIPTTMTQSAPAGAQANVTQAGAQFNPSQAGVQSNPGQASNPNGQGMTDAERAQVEKRAKIVAAAMMVTDRLRNQNNLGASSTGPAGSANANPTPQVKQIQDGMSMMNSLSFLQGTQFDPTQANTTSYRSQSHYERDLTRSVLDQGIPVTVPNFNDPASVLNSLHESIQEINRMKGVFRQHIDREEADSVHNFNVGTGAHALGPVAGAPQAAHAGHQGRPAPGLAGGQVPPNPSVPVFSMSSSGSVPTHIRRPVASSVPILKPNEALNYTWLPNKPVQAPPVGPHQVGAGLAEQYIKLKSAMVGLSMFPPGSQERNAAVAVLDGLTDQIIRNTYNAELSAPFRNYDSYIDSKIVQSIYEKKSLPGNADVDKIQAPPVGILSQLSVEWQKAWDRKVDKAKISGKTATDTITIPDLLDYHSYVCANAVVNLDCQYSMLIGCTQGSLRASLSNLRKCSVPMKDAYALMINSFHIRPTTQTAESILGLIISEMPKDSIETVLSNIVTLSITAVQDTRAEDKVPAAVHKIMNYTWEFLKKWYNHEDVRKVHREFTNAVLDMRSVGKLSSITSFAEVTLMHNMIKDQFQHSIPKSQPLYTHSNTAIMERQFYGDSMKTYMDALDRRSMRSLQGNQGINPDGGKGREMGGFLRIDRHDKPRISEINEQVQDEKPEASNGQLAIGHEMSDNDRFLEEVRLEQETASLSLAEVAAVGQGVQGNAQASAKPVKDLKSWPGCLNCGATRKEDHHGKELFYTKCPFYNLKPGKLQRECCLGFHGNDPKGCARTGKPTNVVSGGLVRPT